MPVQHQSDFMDKSTGEGRNLRWQMMEVLDLRAKVAMLEHAFSEGAHPERTKTSNPDRDRRQRNAYRSS